MRACLLGTPGTLFRDSGSTNKNPTLLAKDGVWKVFTWHPHEAGACLLRDYRVTTPAITSVEVVAT